LRREEKGDGSMITWKDRGDKIAKERNEKLLARTHEKGPEAFVKKKKKRRGPSKQKHDTTQLSPRLSLKELRRGKGRRKKAIRFRSYLHLWGEHKKEIVPFCQKP